MEYGKRKEMIKMTVCGPNSFILTDDNVYEIDLYREDMKLEDFSTDVAYLYGELFYLYNGEITNAELNNSDDLKPGIYWNINENEPVMLHPHESEREKYTAEDKIGEINSKKIIDEINEHPEILVELPDKVKSQSNSLQIRDNDDILKRLIKMAFNLKGLTIEDCSEGFPEKNMRFNYKAAITKDGGELSIKYFNRGIDALKLKYTIIIEEENPNDPMGLKLDEPIIMSSTDTHE